MLFHAMVCAKCDLVVVVQCGITSLSLTINKQNVSLWLDFPMTEEQEQVLADTEEIIGRDEMTRYVQSGV